MEQIAINDKACLKKRVISINLNTGTYQSFVDRVLALAQSNYSSYVCVANVHMTIEAYLDKNFASIVNAANLITPDGMPLVKALRWLYNIKQDRVAGMDLLPNLFLEIEKMSLGIFIYGSTNDVLIKTDKYLQDKFPLIVNKTFYSPPFRLLLNEETSSVVDMINSSGAHIVFVVLGCPKQEKWMASMKGRINACMIGIGGALPVVVGLKNKAPEWMRKSSIEWSYRLCQEPIRLFKRYAVTNSLFILLFCIEFFKIRIINKVKSFFRFIKRMYERKVF